MDSKIKKIVAMIIENDAQFKKLGIEREIDVNIPFMVKNDFDSDKKKVTRKNARYIEGYATTPTKDRVDDIVTLEAIQKAKNDLLKQGARTVFFNHDTDKPIGKVVKTEVTSKGLLVGIKISSAKSVDDIWIQIKEGVLNSMSIRLRYKKVQVEKDEHGIVQSVKILDMELYEVSVVGLPCNPDASITSVVGKSFEKLIQKEGNAKMEKEKKETTRDVVAELLPEMIKTSMKEILPEIMKSLKKEEMEAAAKETEQKQKDAVEATKKAEEAKKQEEETKSKTEDSDLSKSVNELKNAVAELIKAQTKTVRKGAEGTGDGGAGNVVKIRTVKDEATVKKLVDMWINSPDEYDELNDREKAVAKQVYFAMVPYLGEDKD